MFAKTNPMSKIKPFKSKISVQEEAAAWIVKLDSGDLNEADREALSDWLAQSNANRREFAELAEVWGLADHLPHFTEIYTPTHDAAPKTPKQRRNGWRAQQAIAACAVACCVFFAAFFWLASPAEETPVFVEHRTAIGEIRDITLSDGSIVSLNTNSHIEVAYSPRKRSIILDSGEAHFKVAKDKERPFSVEVGEKVVTAVGTAFNIRKSDQGANLIVTEGRVSVDDRDAVTPKDEIVSVASKPMLVSAGEQLSLKAAKAEIKAEKYFPEELEQKLSWTSGMLSFDNTPLTQAISEVSRYTSTKIIIADESLKSINVGGYFKAGETDSMLEALKLSFNIKVQRLDDNVVLLKKNDDQRAIH